MKKINIFFIMGIFTLVFGFIACEKDDDSESNNSDQSKKLIQISKDDYSIVMEYDTEGRLINMQDNSGSVGIFVNTDDMLIIGDEDHVDTLFLNSEGYAIHCDGEDFNYNNDGYRIYPGLVWTDGNVTKYPNEYQGYPEYYTDKLNLGGLWCYTWNDAVEMDNPFGIFMGKPLKNLVKSISCDYVDDEYDDFEIFYTYEFDSDGYVIKATETYSSTSNINVYTFQWSY